MKEKFFKHLDLNMSKLHNCWTCDKDLLDQTLEESEKHFFHCSMKCQDIWEEENKIVLEDEETHDSGKLD